MCIKVTFSILISSFLNLLKRGSFLILFFVAFAIPSTSAQTCTGIPDQECLALYALYNGTGGNQWINDTNWLSSAHVNDWYKVTVENGHVTEISLFNNNLTGSIPPELNKLFYLKFLTLSGWFSGGVPSELGTLANLEILHLCGNLSGEFPLTLINLPKLRVLDLGGNRLSGDIPPELSSITTLTHLFLTNNNFTGEIPRELATLPVLEDLRLDDNELTGGIPPELGSLSSLRSIKLRSNQLSGVIPPEIGNLPSLGDLDLSLNNLTGEIPPELGSLSCLHTLDLSYNYLTGSIPGELGNPSNLLRLTLNSNNLAGELPSFLMTPPAEINLSWNRLFSTNPWILAAVENKHSGNFIASQTLPPENVTAIKLESDGVSENKIQVSWNPVPNLVDPVSHLGADGGYQVFCRRSDESKYQNPRMTINKEDTSLIFSDLEPDIEYTFQVKTFTRAHDFNKIELTSEFSNTAVAVSGSLSRVFIPSWKQSPGYFTGIVVSNFGNSGFNLNLSAYDTNGSLESLGQNPASYVVGSGLQISKLGCELFQSDPYREDLSWIELGVENNTNLGSFFLFGVSDTQMLDGAEAQSSYATKLFFTRPLDERFFEGWNPDIQIFIVNPTDYEVRVICWLKGGIKDSGRSHIIPPKGFIHGNAEELISQYHNVTNGYMEVEVTDGPGVLGFSRIEFPEVRTALGMNAVEPSSSRRLYSAQLAHGDSIVTNLQVINTTKHVRNMILTAVGDDGTPLADLVHIGILGEKIYNTDLGTLFGLEGEGTITTGSLLIECDGEGLVADIIFAEGETLEYAMSLPLQERLFQEAVFNHISNLPTVFTGFAFYNPGNETADILIEAFGIDGEKVAEKILFLGPGERIARTLTDPDIWPEFPDQSGGYIKIRSNQPVAGQQLFGDRALRYMAAIPATTRIAPMFD